MLNATLIRGNNQYAAAHYFSSADDYYAKENPGQWQGAGAEALGLTGCVDQAELAKLLDGKLPNGDRIATTFDRDNKKRMALDLTFSAPKSVSMQALVAGDRAVTDAHDRAVFAALREAEKLAEARRKVGGKTYRERTGNLVIGKFRHELSRAKDPQLHTHAVVMNMTQRADGAWRALSNEDIFATKKVIDSIYQAELAKELTALGYELRIVDDKGNFELAHITRTQIEAFSERSRIIEEALANEGKTRATATTLEKQIASMATREGKSKVEIGLLKHYWVEKAAQYGIDFGPRSALDGYQPLPGQPGDAGPDRDAKPPLNLPAHLTPAQAVVDYAIRHLTEREAVVRESVLRSTALHRAVGLAGANDVSEEIARMVRQGALIEAPAAYQLAGQADSPALSPAGWREYLQTQHGKDAKGAREYVASAIRAGSLVLVEKRFTTHKALKREKSILAMERDGRSKVTPIADTNFVDERLQATALNADQRSAAMAMVTTGDRFIGIQGDAGTGKSYTVKHAVALMAEQGYRTVALAPYGNQVKALKQDGLDAHTLAAFLKTKDKPLDARTVIVLDEAGVVGARQMQQLMREVEKTGARLVLLGDTKQTEAIEAGKPFAQLQQAGMHTSRIAEIQRQKDPGLKLAVAHAAQGQVRTSLERIRHIEEVKTTAERHQAVARDYVSLTESERHATLIVAGTNQSRREINHLVRFGLDLAGTGREFDTLTRVDLTQAQRRYAPSYQAGMVIQPDKDYPRAGLVRGETYRVLEALPGNQLQLARADGTTTLVNPRQATQLSVYHLERTELAIGDTVRVNRNDAKLDLTNGDRFRVTGVVGGTVGLESVEQPSGPLPRRVELAALRPLHLEHAYASTVHSAQGLTNDRALLALDTKSRTTSMNLYYVGISRARHEVRIYTNSVRKLPEAIARRFDKTTALEIQRQREGLRGGTALQRPAPADSRQALQHQKKAQTDGIEHGPG